MAEQLSRKQDSWLALLKLLTFVFVVISLLSPICFAHAASVSSDPSPTVVSAVHDIFAALNSALGAAIHAAQFTGQKVFDLLSPAGDVIERWISLANVDLIAKKDVGRAPDKRNAAADPASANGPPQIITNISSALPTPRLIANPGASSGKTNSSASPLLRVVKIAQASGPPKTAPLFFSAAPSVPQTSSDVRLEALEDIFRFEWRRQVDRIYDVIERGSRSRTDTDIPDTLTASNYLPLSGGTITGPLSVSGDTDLATTTITGALTVNGNTNITEGGQLTVGDKIITPGEIGLGTTTPGAKLAIQNSPSLTRPLWRQERTRFVQSEPFRF